MKTIPENLLKNLETMAESIQAAKPGLCFLGIVHAADAPAGWDLLVSSTDSNELRPRSLEAIRYINEQLIAVLTPEQSADIALIVALPSDNELIMKLSQVNEWPPFSALGRLRTDEFDEAYVIRPIQSPLYWKNSMLGAARR